MISRLRFFTRGTRATLRVGAFAAAACFAAATADARQITLAWDASPDASVTGYMVSYGTQPGIYTTSVDVGNLLSWQVDLPGNQYYFAVRSYDAAGRLSAYSLEVGDAAGVALRNPGDQTDSIGRAISLPLVATGSPVSYNATNLPPGLAINAMTGLISGTIASNAGASSPYLVTVRALDSDNNISSAQFIWTLTVAPVTVTADSVTPNAGSGASQPFAFRFSDTAGALDLTQGWVWINASFASALANTCVAYYTRATNTVSLIDDAGTTWMTATLGSGGTLQNNQCAIALGSGTTAALSGNTLTLTLALSFASAFNGAKNVYTYAQNGTGVNSGWQTRGTWTVPGAPPPGPVTVTADLVTPNAGSGASQAFAFQFSDTAGAMDLAQGWVWINATFASTLANTCLAYYTRATNAVSLMNDAGTTWMTATLGSNGTLQNNQCAIALGSSTTAVLSGNTLTLTLALSFAPAFNGAKNVYTYAQNGTGVNSGWQTRGTWTVPGAPPPPGPVTVTADSVTPNAGSGASQAFAFQLSDTAGAMDLAQGWVWINATFASTLANTCLAYYTRATNAVSLMNDAGTTWMTATLGSNGTLQNNQCAIALGSGTTAALSGNTLTLTLALSFAPAFNGAKNVYTYAQNGAGVNSGWQTRGTWTVPGATPPATVTADAVTPNAGSGASQAFAFQLSDTAGATDLAQGWVWINATFASTLANTCLAYYTRATNAVSLMDNAGTMWMTATLGSGGTLQNNQCAIALGSSTAALSGNTLTLTLALTFAPAFNGAKNVYVYAQNGTAVNSGWQTRGTWTVP